MADRNQRRVARYKRLKEMGFSPSEARRLRDNGGERIAQNLDTRREQLETIPELRRTENQRRNLERLTEWEIRDRQTGLDISADIFTNADRDQEFRFWSDIRIGFPTELQRRVFRWNDERGLSPHDSYGYRKLYYWYVVNGGEDEELAERTAESRDT